MVARLSNFSGQFFIFNIENIVLKLHAVLTEENDTPGEMQYEGSEEKDEAR